MDCACRQDLGQVVFSTGWDEASVLLWALVNKWQRYRLPKASHAFEHAWQTEWMRIREVETEHYMVDIHGMFYELQPIAFENAIWGVKPVCQHLRIIPDYCFTGTGRWAPYGGVHVGASGYAHHIFPTSFSAHWVRLVPHAGCRATASFFYS